MSEKKSKFLSKAIIVVLCGGLGWFVYASTDLKCYFTKCDTIESDTTKNVAAADSFIVVPVDTTSPILKEIDSLNKK